MDYKDVNDYELLYMVSDSSEECIQMLFEKYKPAIRQHIRKWASLFKKFGLEIQDIEQEVYYSLVLAVRNYDEYQNTSLYTYFMKTLDNTIIKIVRAYNTNKCHSLNNAISLSSICGEQLELQDCLEDSSDSIDIQVEEQQLQNDIYQFCYGLPIEQAFIFELCMSGFENKKIEILLGIRKTNVSNAIFRLKKRLQKDLIKIGYLIQ